jgi:epoxyqueuosine reductase
MISREQFAQAAKQAAADAGFELAGVSPVHEEHFSELAAFPEWIEAGHAGEMEYMKKRTESGRLRRASVRNVAPWAKSVVVCAINYSAAKPYSTSVRDPRRGWISRYAWGSADYHDVLLPRLRRIEDKLKQLAAQDGREIEIRSYVDTGPMLERVYAKYAGIGWIGKNTCIINQKMGSWLFLGVILTSLELAPDVPAADRCGSCTRCIDACPTEAIVAPGKLDARRCIAYLTIEKRGTIAEEFRSGIGNNIFGCDICQDVCPWNNKNNKPANAPTTRVAEFEPQEALFHPDLKQLSQMDEESYRQRFRGSPVKRAKYSGLRRNVAVAMGNSGDGSFIPELERMSADPDPVVVEHARWALNKLRSS